MYDLHAARGALAPLIEREAKTLSRREADIARGPTGNRDTSETSTASPG